MKTLIITALLLAGSAQAQECRQRELSNKPFLMPTGLFCKIGDDGMTCFTLEEYKKLLEMDHALHIEKEKAREKDSIITNQGLIIQQKDAVIVTLEKDKDVLEEQVTRLGEKWRTCLEESEGIPWSSIGWGAAVGVVVGVIAGGIAYLTLSVPQRVD
jgi:ElaB/YqjD/DUF883 family membrane-anchored ribosome-binding protein